MTDIIVSDDHNIFGTNTTYALARATSESAYAVPENFRAGITYINSNVYVFRGYLAFDTSGIGANGTVTQVNLSLTGYSDPSGTAGDSLLIVKQDWSSGTGENIYDGTLTADLDDAAVVSGIMSAVTSYTSGNLSTAWVNKTGITYYALISSMDRNNTFTDTYSLYSFYALSATTESRRPKLVVTYTEGGSSTVHRMSLLGVGK